MFKNKKSTKLPKLGVITGNGSLPHLIISEYQKNGGECITILIDGFAKPEEYKYIKNKTLGIGQVSSAIEFLRKNNVTRIIFAGGVKKPNLTTLKTDKKGLILVGKLAKTKIFGDNNVLQTVVDFFADEGFDVVGVKDLLKETIAKKGVINNIKIKDKKFYEDIKLGNKVLDSISGFDIGQSVIIQQNLVLGIEGIEGTDELIKRYNKLKYKSGRMPVLVKAKKKNQTNKADLPVIGINTIKNLHKAGFAGVAVEAENTILLDKYKIIELADEKGIFVVGV
ncbi:LpxI family protein [Pseudomonadota bacterium]